MAITGLPSSIASAIVIPKPSERCSDTYASQLTISRFLSVGLQELVEQVHVRVLRGRRRPPARGRSGGARR